MTKKATRKHPIPEETESNAPMIDEQQSAAPETEDLDAEMEAMELEIRRLERERVEIEQAEIAPIAGEERAELERLKTERTSREAPPEEKPWDEVAQSIEASVGARERRLGSLAVLPRLIAAAKARRLRLSVRKQEGELAPLLSEREAAGAEVRTAEEKLRGAEEELRAVRGRYHAAFHAVLDRQGRLKRTRREMAELAEQG